MLLEYNIGTTLDLIMKQNLNYTRIYTISNVYEKQQS